MKRYRVMTYGRYFTWDFKFKTLKRARWFWNLKFWKYARLDIIDNGVYRCIDTRGKG